MLALSSSLRYLPLPSASALDDGNVVGCGQPREPPFVLVQMLLHRGSARPVQLSLRNKLDAFRMVAPRRLAGCFHPPYNGRNGGVCSANSLSRLNLQASQAGKQIRLCARIRKTPYLAGLERLCPTEGRRLARQSLLSEPQIRRWRPVLWGRTFHASSRSRKEPSHPIDSSWVGTPARLIA